MLIFYHWYIIHNILVLSYYNISFNILPNRYSAMLYYINNCRLSMFRFPI